MHKKHSIEFRIAVQGATGAEHERMYRTLLDRIVEAWIRKHRYSTAISHISEGYCREHERYFSKKVRWEAHKEPREMVVWVNQ